MWGKVSNREEWIDRATNFTGDHVLYGSWMQKVIEEWPISCEHNLTNLTQNRKAWLGHAAVAMAIQCPEDIVRLAWSRLTDEQRQLANNEADKAIKKWEESYV